MRPGSHAVRVGRGEMAATLITLFTSSGTLVCCALPITLVTLGLGSAMITLTTRLPILVALSDHKLGVFAVSAVMLVLSGWLLYRPKRSCPADPKLAVLCNRLQRWNRGLYALSVVVWLIGFFAAFVAVHLYQWMR